MAYTAFPDSELRDILFEPTKTPLVLFSYLANENLTQIIVRNDSKQTINLPLGYCLGYLEEYNYKGYFYIIETL